MTKKSYAVDLTLKQNRSLSTKEYRTKVIENIKQLSKKYFVKRTNQILLLEDDNADEFDEEEGPLSCEEDDAESPRQQPSPRLQGSPQIFQNRLNERNAQQRTENTLSNIFLSFLISSPGIPETRA